MWDVQPHKLCQAALKLFAFLGLHDEGSCCWHAVVAFCRQKCVAELGVLYAHSVGVEHVLAVCTPLYPSTCCFRENDANSNCVCLAHMHQPPSRDMHGTMGR